MINNLREILPSKSHGIDTHICTLHTIESHLHEKPVAFISHPVFLGQDFTIRVSPTGFDIEGLDPNEEIFHRVHDECIKADDGLKALLEEVQQLSGCDHIELQCRFVPRYMQPEGIIDIFRILAIKDGQVIRQLPYQEDVLETDIDAPPRFATWISRDTIQTRKQLLQEATDQLLNDTAGFGDEFVQRFEDLIWIPFDDTSGMPSVMTYPCATQNKVFDTFDFISGLRKSEPKTMFHLSGVVPKGTA